MKSLKYLFSVFSISAFIAFGLTACGGGEDAADAMPEQTGESTSQPGTAEKIRGSVLDTTSKAAQSATKMAESAGEATKEAATEAVHATKEAAQATKEAAAEAVQAVEDKIAVPSTTEPAKTE